MIYRFHLQEHLDPIRAEWFLPLNLEYQPDGSTILVGVVQDQAELHSILIRLRNLNLTLISVTYVEA